MSIPKIFKAKRFSAVLVLSILVLFVLNSALVPQLSVLATPGVNPEVDETTPSDGATNVEPDANIAVTFTEPMMENPPMMSPITVTGSASGVHTFDLNIVGYNYFINPDTDFTIGEDVTVFLPAGLLDIESEQMQNDYQFTFTILSDQTPPNPPTNLTANSGDGFVDLNWTLSTSPDVDSQNVYRGIASGGPYTFQEGIGSTETTYNDTKVVNGTTYYYVLTAQDAAGNESAYSNEASATPSQADIDPPYTQNLNPAPGASNIPVSTNIYLEIVDTQSGVDLNTVDLTVEGTLIVDNGVAQPGYTVTIAPVANGYSLDYNPSTDFSEYQTVNVSVDAADLATPPNVMPTYNYSFVTEDATAPYTDNYNPAPGATDVPVDTNVVFQIHDDASGVNLNSIQVDVNGVVYQQGIPGFSTVAISDGYQVTINPASNFPYNTVIPVDIDAQDVEGNVMPTYSYSFTTSDSADTDAPYITNLNPNPAQEGVPTDTNIYFELIDDGTGVDLNTIDLVVEGTTIVSNGVVQPGYTVAITPITGGYSVDYDPNVDFSEYQTVNVTARCSDLASTPNSMSYDYWFMTSDLTPPYTSNHNPADGATGVPIDTNISFDIADDASGVNLLSVSVNVDGTIYRYGVPGFSYVGDPSSYTITIDPASNFPYSTVIPVAIDAADNDGNVMATDTYSFTTEDQGDIEPPYFTNMNPAPGQTNVPVDTNIYLEVLDNDIGVDQWSIDLTVEGVLVIDDGVAQPGFTVAINPIANGFSLDYDPSADFGEEQQVDISVSASDLAVPANSNSYDYFFTTEDLIPPTTSNYNPAPGATGVLVDSNVSFDVSDLGSGVDIATVSADVNGTLYTNGVPGFSYVGDPSNYTVTIDPASDFAYGATIPVTLYATDLAGNVMTPYSYSFDTETVSPDLDPPYVQNENPADGAINVSLDSNVYFEVVDDDSGVDLSTVDLTVEGSLVIDDGVTQPGFTVIVTPLANGYSFDYDPSVDFPSNDTINIAIDATDNDGNVMPTYNYSFDTVDTIPPQMDLTNPSDPDDGATGVPVGSNVTFRFNEPMDNTTLNASSVLVTGSVSGPMTGSFSYASVTFNPDTDFVPGETVTAMVVSDIAADLAGNTLDGNRNGIAEGSPIDDYTISFTVADQGDVTPPNPPLVIWPADGAVLSDNTPLIYGTAEARSEVSIYIDGFEIITVTADATGNFVYSMEQELSTGEHTVYAYATDATGNRSARSNANTFIVDTGIVLGAVDSLFDTGSAWLFAVVLALLAAAGVTVSRFVYVRLKK
ncbi:Ig-like domain-containing protein [Patescibacteria group bacterium]